MTKTKITGKQAIKALKKAVELKGEDYVYPESKRGLEGECLYQAEGEPLCIVGVALDSLGVDLKGRTNLGVRLINTYWKGVKLTPKAQEIFAKAQQIQDENGTWGDALHQGMKEARLVP